jgi:hypothetical protein
MIESKGTKSYNLTWVALDKHILIVEVSSAEINYGVFVGAVRGDNYDVEALEVAITGSSVWPQLADIYFKDSGSGRPIKQIHEYQPFFEPSAMNYRLLGPPILEIRPIDKHVLLVAVRADGGTWNAFIGAVKGEDYVVEAQGIVKTGTPVSYELAEVCFEDLAKGERWHEPLRVFIGDEDYGPAQDWGDERPVRPDK